MLLYERAVALGATPTFAGLPDHVLARLAEHVTEATYADGDVIIAEGRDESWMFVLVAGQAAVDVGGTRVATLGAGSAIGELAVLDPAPRSATVTAMESCHLLRLEHHALHEMMIDHPLLMSGLLTMLARRLRDANPHSETSDTAVTSLW
ncbi:MAG: cyclic nucleotide-binding domain-containing protein [Actinomycetota bacterium]